MDIIKLNEILLLEEMLQQKRIPYIKRDCNDGLQIIYPNLDWEISCVIHSFSYGREDGLIEIMGLLTEEEIDSGNSVVGGLTAQEVFDRIWKNWTLKNK